KGEPKLSYYDSGGGVTGEPPILLIHASLYRSEDWENIFPRLATRYRVVSYDQRGHGRSERASSYELRAFADDALRVLREVEKGPVPSPGPHGERTYGEMRGFYAAERVATYFKDVDPAFLDWRMTTTDPSAPLIAAAVPKVKAPILVVTGEVRLGAAFDDTAEFTLKRQIKDLNVKRFPGHGHVVHGFRPDPFLDTTDPFL